MAAKKYFDNNWQEYKDAPDEFFHEHTYEEVMQWKVGGWEFPSSVVCIIREENTKNGKIKEHVYRKNHAASAKIDQLLVQPDTAFTVADHSSIYYLSKKRLPYDFGQGDLEGFFD